jgi:hypothetical protein
VEKFGLPRGSDSISNRGVFSNEGRIFSCRAQRWNEGRIERIVFPVCMYVWVCGCVGVCVCVCVCLSVCQVNVVCHRLESGESQVQCSCFRMRRRKSLRAGDADAAATPYDGRCASIYCRLTVGNSPLSFLRSTQGLVDDGPSRVQKPRS